MTDLLLLLMGISGFMCALLLAHVLLVAVKKLIGGDE